MFACMTLCAEDAEKFFKNARGPDNQFRECKIHMILFGSVFWNHEDQLFSQARISLTSLKILSGLIKPNFWRPTVLFLRLLYETPPTNYKKYNSKTATHWTKLWPLAFLPQVYYHRERGLQDTEEETDKEEQVLTFSGNRTEGRLPGLQPYSVYSLFIRVLNNKGEGPPSPSKTFETPEGGVYAYTWLWRP